MNSSRASVCGMWLVVAGGFLALSLVLLMCLVLINRAHAKDDGRYANAKLKPWFDSLKSRRGPCCSDADGSALSDNDWRSKDGQFMVRIDDKWIDVPEDAVLTQPNLAGKTMVWPLYSQGVLTIRCFIPGEMG